MDKEYIEINRKAYSIFADEYYEKMLKENRYKDITDKLCKYVYDAYINANNGKKPESVLELGPGLGATLLLFSTTYNCNVTGVELSNRMAEKARGTAYRATIIEDDVNNITNFHKCQFDIIYASAFIHLFPRSDAEKVLKKISEWLTDSGIIFLSTTLHKISEEGYFGKYDYSDIKHFRRNYEESDLKALIEECNLKIIKEEKSFEKERGKNWINLICQKSEAFHVKKILSQKTF